MSHTKRSSAAQLASVRKCRFPTAPPPQDVPAKYLHAYQVGQEREPGAGLFSRLARLPAAGAHGDTSRQPHSQHQSNTMISSKLHTGPAPATPSHPHPPIHTHTHTGSCLPRTPTPPHTHIHTMHTHRHAYTILPRAAPCSTLTHPFPCQSAPGSPAHGAQFFNFPASIRIHSQFSPMYMLRKLATVEDFVVLKLGAWDGKAPHKHVRAHTHTQTTPHATPPLVCITVI